MKKIRILDLVFSALILTVGLFLTIKVFSNKGGKVIVNADGQKYEFSSRQDGSYTVEGRLGPTIFEIKNGRVHITDSPCPNKTCINQGWHTPLICLPNNVIITIENSENKGGLDAVSE